MEKHSPEGAVYNKYARGTITANSWLTHEFYKRGWRWGGELEIHTGLPTF